jgi:hypothetical protein
MFSMALVLLPGSFLTFDLPNASQASMNGNTQPRVCLAPEASVKWTLGEKFNVDVLVENVSGMRGIYFEIYLDGFYDDRVPTWSPVLNTSANEIEVHEEVLPRPYKAYGLTIIHTAERSWLKFLCILDCATAPQNGTARILSINFTVLDPWYCGRQPVYIKNEDKWIPVNATSQITLWWGYLILQYPNLHYEYFGKFFGSTEGAQGYALYNSAGFTFMPIPGDLDGNGMVDTIDLMVMSQFYSLNITDYPNCYYDLNRDGAIDSFDITIVTTNYGRTDPRSLVRGV